MKKIIILGSTGSIGRQTLEILRKDKKNFDFVLLSTDKNIKLLLKQIKIFKLKNVVVSNKKKYEILKKKIKNINILPDFKDIDKKIKSRADYTISAISGLEGLNTPLKNIKKTKRIAIAN